MPAMPGLPGAANTSVPGDCASFHASACSLPPLPITRILILVAPLQWYQCAKRYDVVVIGAGHAGCEAARAAARMGLKTAMVTMNLDLIAQMSCNPAIGGIAKGHLVREIDALGGVMGEVADAVGIQFRLLNTSRGPAVWSPRAQMDKKLYRVRMREVLEQEPNLRIKQAEVAAPDHRRTAPRRRASRLRDGRTIGCGRGDRHDGDISEWPGARGRNAVQLRAQRRSAFAIPGRPVADAGPALDAPQDRHAAAAGWPHHRLVAVRAAAGRCRTRRRSRF